ncbi:MAG: hypothetical protein WCR52_11840 [Bacteroidota bacterium]
MKLILAIPAFSLLCSSAIVIDKKAPAHDFTPVPPTVEESIAPKMWSTHPAVYKGESLELFFAPPNPTYLGVIDPDGRFFYLVYPKESMVGNLKPLVDSERFADMETLVINTSTLTADPYTYGVLDNQPVFTKTGIYRFVLGNDLHVDDESLLEIVKIRYTHREKGFRG